MDPVKTLISVINPFEDHQNTPFDGMFIRKNDRNLDENVQAIVNWGFYTFKSIAKPVFRGGIIGGLVGLGLSYLDKQSNGYAFALDGALIGGVIDAIQYQVRGSIGIKKAYNDFRRFNKNN